MKQLKTIVHTVTTSTGVRVETYVQFSPPIEVSCDPVVRGVFENAGQPVKVHTRYDYLDDADSR